jgi:NAD(P)-dependent dehydrogenase (short-subunit alcohol dehydrogenase family)
VWYYTIRIPLTSPQNISSLAGQVSLGPQVAYIAAKHGVTGITKAAAAEYSGQGVRCNAVAPGFIEVRAPPLPM